MANPQPREKIAAARAAPRPAEGIGTEAATRVADVLLLFAGGPQYLGVTAISRELGLSKAVVHRILRSLVTTGMLQTDPGVPGYRLGPAAVALGVSALSRYEVRTAALPILRRLRDETGETTTLSSLVGDERVYLKQFESPHEVKMTVELGQRFPLHAGSSGKAILAFLPADQREALLARPLEPVTALTVTDGDTLRAELAEIARSGLAVSVGERQSGAGSIAAPLFDPGGEAHGSISVCGPGYRFTPELVARHRELVLAAAQEINRSWAWLRSAQHEPGA